MANRLADETSPYLLQHAENPVAWQPWDGQALEQARREDKPILVSIGYSACHWCHVMERESFEDPAVAAVMNEHFVAIKVDREERPDVDALYMEAVQVMTGSGGWPLNAFLTPEGVPFYAGTYFPPRPTQGLPSWRQVLEGVANAWQQDRDNIIDGSERIAERLRATAQITAPDAELDRDSLDLALARTRRAYDATFGGWGSAPKFPHASVIDLLLTLGDREMALHTMRRMAAGGIYDQVGGGFSRYSVDARWLVPHFEKMLYDNALLARSYLHGFQVTGDTFFRRICTETLDWALRELRQPEGGFASALDADSEGVEGKYYVWTLDEVRDALGPELAAEAIEHFGMTEAGNFEGRNIPLRAKRDPERLAEIKARLYEVREQRVRPGLDDKRVASWNGLMISALADAGGALERDDYVEAAVACAEFVLRDMRDADGTLLRTYNRGRAKTPAFLEDHAYLLEAFLDLYAATFDPRWFAEAERMAGEIAERFEDRERGGFFSTAAGSEPLLARRKDLEDAPTPSGGSSAAFGLLRLARLTGETRWEDAALGWLRLVHTIAHEHPSSFGHALRALDFHLAPVREVAIVGPDAAALERTVRGAFRPHVVLAGGEPDGVPLLEGRGPVDGRAAAHVCERFACRQPVTAPDELAALLD
jgi:uncharacterized protein YyaL (SSP411 family)